MLLFYLRKLRIDDNPVTSPHLCLKLFDNRFQLLDIPNEEDECYKRDDLIPRWFEPVAEDCAINEAQTSSTTATVIPWFYGNHQAK
jgi:hypothetical protein